MAMHPHDITQIANFLYTSGLLFTCDKVYGLRDNNIVLLFQVSNHMDEMTQDITDLKEEHGSMSRDIVQLKQHEENLALEISSLKDKDEQVKNNQQKYILLYKSWCFCSLCVTVSVAWLLLFLFSGCMVSSMMQSCYHA